MDGIKYDDKKLRYDLLPIEPIEEVVRVLMYGAKKYDDDNWKRVPDLHKRYYAAAMRHLTAYWKGEVNDPESGFHHLAHAACCILFTLWVDKTPART